MGAATYTDLTLYKRLLRQARPYWLHIIGISLLSLLSTPLALLTPLPLKIAVDHAIGLDPLPRFLDELLPSAITGSRLTVLAFAAGLLVAVALLTQLQTLASSLLRTYTGEQLTLNFRAQIFHHVQRLSFSYHDSKGTSDPTYRIQYDAPAIQHIAIDGVIPFITAIFTLASMLYVTSRLDWQLAVVALMVSPILFLLTQVYRKQLRSQSSQVKKLESSALSVVQEVLMSLRVVKAFGQEDREQERFLSQSSKGMWARIRLSFSEGGLSLLIGLTTAIGTATVLFIGARNVQAGVLTLGELLLVMGYLTQLYEPLKTISKRIASLQSHLASAERAFSLLDEAPDVDERTNARPISRAKGSIAFHNVSFAYNNDQLVLRDISFNVLAGTRVGIVGRTGAGKTTLMNLLTRFYDPTAGQIILDGVDLRDYKLADLRNQFAIVLQEPVLFSTSIAENIAYAKPSADEEEIVKAAKAANAHEFIMDLPDGYNTLVGERGMRLSGGERQRIALARAFLRDASILILDEPTSSVDVKTEAGIVEAMERLMKGRTTFMIAHRLSTLDICNMRIEIDQGHVITNSSDLSSMPAKSIISVALPLKEGTHTLVADSSLRWSPDPLQQSMALPSYCDGVRVHSSRNHKATPQPRNIIYTEHLTQVELNSSEAQQQVTLPEIEQVIEYISARYTADLRTLSEELTRFYEAQLTAKGEQIVELSQCLKATESERDLLEAQLRQLKHINTKYIADLQALSEESQSAHGEHSTLG